MDNAIYYAGEVIKSHPLVDREGYKAMMENGYSLKGNMLIKSELISSSNSEQEGAGTYDPLITDLSANGLSTHSAIRKKPTTYVMK